MSFPDLLYRIAHQYPGAVPALAARMGKNQTVLQHKLNPNCSTHGINADEIEHLVDFSGSNLEVAEYFAGKVGAVVVKLADLPTVGDMELLDEFLGVLRELGELSAEFQHSWADGRITPQEFTRIRKEANDVQAQIITLLARIESLVEPDQKTGKNIRAVA
jgi:hypothetical protein